MKHERLKDLEDIETGVAADLSMFSMPAMRSIDELKTDLNHICFDKNIDISTSFKQYIEERSQEADRAIQVLERYKRDIKAV